MPMTQDLTSTLNTPNIPNMATGNLDLSVVIITLNAEKHLQACLNSIAFCKQLVIVDSGSVDFTQAIVQKFAAQHPSITVEFYTSTPWPGFGQQKNLALSYAKCAWILSLDADEVLDETLQNSLKKQIQLTDLASTQKQNNVTNAFYVHRQNFFCGKAIAYSGWQNDKVVRLIANHQGIKFTDVAVHESLTVSIKSAKSLAGYLQHYSYTTLEDVLHKVQQYSTLGAKQLRIKNPHAPKSYAKALGHSLWAFIRTFFLKKGFLDGWAGFNIALMNALASYYKYAKF